MNNPFLELTEYLQRIEKKLDLISSIPKPSVKTDRICLEEAIVYLNENGCKIGKSKLYKLTSSNQIPHGILGPNRGRLIFSRKELAEWIDQNTVKVNLEKLAANNLAQVAKRKND
jgi:hypothetical protein